MYTSYKMNCESTMELNLEELVHKVCYILCSDGGTWADGVCIVDLL